MKTKDFKANYRTIAVMLLLMAGLSTQGYGQPPTSHSNQIQGTIQFTNTNPDILNVLNPPGDQGFSQVTVTADSIPPSPPFHHRTDFVPATLTSTPYEITVEAGEIGSGIRYRVAVDLSLDSDRDSYLFAPDSSPPVEVEPAANAELNFAECAALLDVVFVTPAGAPAAVDGGFITARRETSPGSGSFQFQAQANRIREGSTQEYLAVRGGSHYELNIGFKLGTDPFVDQMSFRHHTTVEAACDEVVPIQVEIPEFGDLGEIVGTVDVLGEEENRIGDKTFMRADSGPFENFRFDTVDVPTPSNGPFRLENLVPTTSEAKYRVYGNMSLRRGRRSERFQMPFLNDVAVSAGETTDLGNAFVIDPGFVRGEIFLEGPPAGPFGSCLADIFRNSDQDSDGDGIPDDHLLQNSSVVAAVGRNTAAGAFANALFEGDYNPNPEVDAFEGDYELVLGGLFGESSSWRVRRFLLRFVDQATPEVPESYLHSGITVEDLDLADLEIVPGEVLDVPIRRCFGQLNLGFVSTSTDFYAPSIKGSGSFSGTDFESNPANYAVDVNYMFGTPTRPSEATREGLVIGCLPEGSYNFTPSIVAINPGGGFSNTQLPPVLDLKIECGQTKIVELGLEVQLDPLARCSAEPTAKLTGSAEGTGEASVAIDEIWATVDGGSPISFCTDCGEDPPFELDVPLQECGNQVKIFAEDEFGRVSSTTASTRFDDHDPLLEGCEDLEVMELASSGAVVDFVVTSTDNCDGTRSAICDPPSGSLFPQGVTEVTCTAVDTCGNESSCSFEIRPPGIDEVYFLQDVDGGIFRAVPSTPPLVSEQICETLDVEVNSAGLRATDGKLYGVELTKLPAGNRGIVRIDPESCTIESLGSAGLPDDQRFDAGAISSDGATLFVNRAGLTPLYAVDLTASPLVAMEVEMVGAQGHVHDWAFNPADGLLYGGDSLHGELAGIDPVSGERTDTPLLDVGLGGLPTGIGYGGAWFNAAGRLVLHRNDGKIYDLDLDGPAIVQVATSRGSLHNEAAACCHGTSADPDSNGEPDGDEAFLLRDVDGAILRTDSATPPFDTEQICEPLGLEINSAGFRTLDGLLYGVELTTAPSGNRGIVSIDPQSCTFESLGSAGLPSDLRFDAGDVSSDGGMMFVNRAGLDPLYTVDLTASVLSAVRVEMTGARGHVHDWAYNPTDGLLYGGDSSDGELAILNPDSGARHDQRLMDDGHGQLPRGIAFGGAWFDAAGRLVLLRNDGKIYGVDVTVPAIVQVAMGQGSSRNEGAVHHQSSP